MMKTRNQIATFLTPLTRTNAEKIGKTAQVNT
jgi:hypothetical protein